MEQLSLLSHFDLAPAFPPVVIECDANASAPPPLPAVPPRPAPMVGATHSLADVMAFVAADPMLSPEQRRDRLCAMRMLARILNKEPWQIAAAPRALMEAYRSVVPGAHGISAARWANIRSRTLTSLIQAGIPAMPGRSCSDLSTAWARAIVLLGKRGKLGLSRFMRFCTEHEIAPAEVTDAVFDRFRLTLESQSTVKAPHTVHRTACDQWNKAAALVDGWPPVRVRVPVSGSNYAFAWADFPDSFRSDVEAFLCPCNVSDPFAEEYMPVRRASTVQLHRARIRQMASLLVRDGVAIDSLTALAQLAEPAAAKRILLAAHKRLGKGSPQLHGMAMQLKVIAERWSKAAPAAVAILSRFANQAATGPRGMTAKNRQRLRQFDSLENVRALLDLPRRTFAALDRCKQPTQAEARRAMQALAVEFLITMPMRISNLTALDLDRHLTRTGSGRKVAQHVVIPGHETKTGEPYEVTMPRETVALMETYRRRYLPLISETSSTLLFPNASGIERDRGMFSAALGKFVRRETGLIMNAHLFRHLAVTLYLRQHPEDVETARRILGHRSITTTLRFYAALKTEASFSRYDVVIAAMRSPPSTPTMARRASWERR